MATRYHPEFTQGVKNELPIGRDLVIKVHEGPTYIIGQLFKKQSFFRKKLIQIEQTGSRANPQRDSIVFEMKEPDGQPMEPGKYSVKTYAYFADIGGKRWNDDFEIVP